MTSQRKSSLAFLSADQRRALIAEQAYYIAQSRDFAAGGEDGDWLEAERLVDTKLTAMAAPTAPAEPKPTRSRRKESATDAAVKPEIKAGASAKRRTTAGKTKSTP